MSDSCVSTPRKMHLCRSSSMRHNRMHFFDSSTSKSAPTLRCFVHFDFEMCFAPHRRALFRHLIFQKCSDVGVRCTFLLRNVLRATPACNFSSLISCRFSEPTFRSARAPKHWKKHAFSRLFYLFAHLHLLSSDPFSPLIFFFLLFSSLTLPTSAFSSVHIVGSLTSKLPSNIPMFTS